jgi:alpha-tubulin suppressor-like RCC1 family protein
MKTKYIFLNIVFLLFLNTLSHSQCFTKISSGDLHIAAVKSDGTILTWGWGNWGQHGNGLDFELYFPAVYGNPSFEWKEIKAGKYSTYAIRQDNTLWGSGGNDFGQMGVGNTNVTLLNATQLGNGLTWKHISATNHTYGIQTNGTLWGWGQNDGRQMGGGAPCCSDVLSPVQIGSDSDWRQVEASQTRSGLALKDNGTVWGWGTNNGRLITTPSVQVVPFPIQIGTDSDWSIISVGSSQCLALKTNGTLWSWGANSYGQNGTGSNSNVPQQVSSDTWLYVSAGLLSSYGIKSNGTLWSWGRNNQGQLGDGTNIEEREFPVQIGTDTNWVAVAGGAFHAVALKADGSLWAWGNNQMGQYGNGTTATSPIPLYIPLEGCTLSVSDFQLVPVVMAPNPANDKTTLYFKNSLEKVTLTVYDLSGRMMINQEIEGLNQYHLNTSDFPVGIYLVEVKNNGKLLGNYKLVKE